MKHVFVVNPASGKEDATSFVAEQVRTHFGGTEFEIYVTKCAGDAQAFVRTYCRSRGGGLVRFYACGGDGTLHEVINGAAGFGHAAVGCIPCGSGNDFIKYYGKSGDFLDFSRQWGGQEVPIDLIRVGERYAVNAVHFGFDSAVARRIPKFRRSPLIPNALAYPAAVACSLVDGMKHRCSLYADGACLNPEGEILLCTIANGQYVGGSYRCAPRSKNDDGLLEICVVKPMSVLAFMQRSQIYRNGEHLEHPKFADRMVYQQAPSVEVVGGPNFIYSVDGEIVSGSAFTARVEPGAMRFLVPAGLLSERVLSLAA